jgi:DNA repair exonuclease SbcCD ATPase subunit
MKLLACHIDNFGKLSDVTLQFYDGLNVINEANGWGKSTFAAFLKAMFYGLDTKKNVGDFEKERVMYRPWQGGAFGGEVEFEVDGKCYRVSRTFGRTEKSDEFHLYDLSTNLEVCDFSEELGNEIFELDSASFKRSIYIAQNDCASETSDSINAKLGNLAEKAGVFDYIVLIVTMICNFILEFLWTRYFIYRNTCDTLNEKQ